MGGIIHYLTPYLQDAVLVYMVGGDAGIVTRCRPLFMSSAQKVIHTGEVGTGIALKLCNNLMTYAAFTAVSEAVSLAEACDLDLQVLYELGEANGVVTEQMKSFVSNRNALAEGCELQVFEDIFRPFGELGYKGALPSYGEI